jgi:hypothetical protein
MCLLVTNYTTKRILTNDTGIKREADAFGEVIPKLECSAIRVKG